MRKTRKIFYLVTIFALGCFCLCTGALADYSVSALLPENQMNPDISYFDLKLIPGQTQSLYVTIKNKETEEIRVSVEANTAFSNSNGIIDYSHTENRDASMKVDFQDIVTPVESIITVPPKNEVLAEFLLVTPDEPFDGDVLGGLVFTKLEQAASEDEPSMAIRNVFQYVIGVRLREQDEPVEPQFELIGVEKGTSTREVLVVTLRNPQPLIAKRMNLTVNAYREESAEPVFTFENENLRMAPNSTMHYNVRTTEKTVLESGVYNVIVEVSYENEIWRFEAPLSVE